MRRTSAVYNVKVVLHATLVVMEEHGGEFISGKRATSTGELPTSHFVVKKLQSVPHESLINAANDGFVQEILSHFKSVISPPEPDDFLTKVKEILSIGSVSERMIGFIVALPHTYNQHKNRVGNLSRIADKYAQSNYIGEVGNREEFFVKLIDTNNIQKKDNNGSVQDLTIYRVTDQLGNYGYFFSKLGSLSNLDGTPIIKKFDCFLMKATPKKHGVGNNGIKETQFSRVRIIENVGKGSEE
jgi:hypothetical protein